MNLVSKVFTIIAITILLSLCFFLLQNTVEEVPPKVAQLYISNEEKNNSIKTILYWTPMFQQKDFYLGTGSAGFEHCTYSNCYATYNKSYLPIHKFDALIFHGVQYTVKSYGIPSLRSSNQRYIFFCMESPFHTHDFIKAFKDFYNWTMTYRLDSDILRPYGAIDEKKSDYRPPSVEEIRRRPKKIAWMVSNCDTPSERELLQDELKKYVPVDVYGKCGHFSCPKSNDSCYRMIEKHYKFYLSFENSLCDDYVTEKLFNILRWNLVPIVYGGANYTKIAPPNSVINVMDFKSIKHLVKYIKYLDANPEEYLRFFEWKKNYVVGFTREKTLCSLCQKLNEDIKPKIYGDIATWWRGKDFERCTKQKKIIKTFL